MALRQSNLTLCDVNSIASRITTSFDKAIGPSQHKIIARAADNDRLPLAIDDRHYIKLKADLGWSSKQMKEWFAKYLEAKAEEEERITALNSTRKVLDWELTTISHHNEAEETTSRRQSIPSFPLMRTGSIVETEVEAGYAEAPFLLEGLSVPQVMGMGWAECARQYQYLRDEKEKARCEKRKSMRQRAKERRKQLATLAIASLRRMESTGEGKFRTRRSQISEFYQLSGSGKAEILG